MNLIHNVEYSFYCSKELDFNIIDNSSRINHLDANPPGDWVAVSTALKLMTDSFTQDQWNILEVGTAHGHFLKSMHLYLETIKSNNTQAYGLDSKLHGYDPRFFNGIDMHFVDGKSTDRSIIDSLNDNFHFIFIDACHCRLHVLKDLTAYHNKVKIGGYLGLHDTSPKFQGGTEQPKTEECDQEDTHINVIKGIQDFNIEDKGFELIIDEYDNQKYWGGVRIYKRIK